MVRICAVSFLVSYMNVHGRRSVPFLLNHGKIRHSREDGPDSTPPLGHLMSRASISQRTGGPAHQGNQS